MRRYAIRFLAAILTFGIGVTLSLVLGLFKPAQEIRVAQTWNKRSCPKEFRYGKRAFVTVDRHAESPLKLVYPGSTADSPHDRMQLSVENRSGKRVSEYWISGERIRQTSEKSSNHYYGWSFNEVLDPGESRLITLPISSEGMTVRVVRVTFQDGSIWVGPGGSY